VIVFFSLSLLLIPWSAIDRWFAWLLVTLVCVCVCVYNSVSMQVYVCVSVRTSVLMLTSNTSFKLDTKWLIFGSSEQRQTSRPAREGQCILPSRYRGSITGVTCVPYWIIPGPHLGALHFKTLTGTPLCLMYYNWDQTAGIAAWVG